MALSFDWKDPLHLDEQLTDDERMIRDTAAKYAQSKLAPRVLEAFRTEYTDPAIFREMGEIGLLGATIPEEYGGLGLDHVTLSLLLEEIAYVDITAAVIALSLIHI